jgi:Zn-dependent peptidase ImmA (M78 family)
MDDEGVNMSKADHLLKRLTKLAKGFGFKVYFRPIEKDEGLHIYGYIAFFGQEIVINTAKKPNGKRVTKGDKCFVLAHELCHLMHYITGEFKEYYFSVYEAKYQKRLSIGHKAEIDCDNYAKKIIKDEGIYSTLVHRKYPIAKVKLSLDRKIRKGK